MTMIAQEPAALRPALGRFQQVALIVGSVATLLAVAGAFLGAAQFFHSYIFAYFFWFALSLGGLLVLMINHLTQGVWGLMLRRLLEAAALNLILMAILFLPIAIETLTGTHYLFPWTNPEVVAHDEVVALKTPYLNVPFFLARAVIYFVLFIGMAYLLRQWSLEEDAKGFSENLRGRFQRLSGPGIVVLVLAWTLAATDWGMSLEPEWFSSMYPVTYIASMLILTFGGGIIALAALKARNLLPFGIPTDRLHDLGKFLFAFVAVWAYVNFSEYLIIWSGNVPELTPWHGHRSAGGWEILGIAMIFGHFLLPFMLLLSRFAKRRIANLTAIAVYMFVIEIVWYFWKIMPAFHPDGFHIHWLDLVTLIAIGGLWLGTFAWHLQRAPLLAPNDYRVPLLRRQEAGGHGHGHHGKAAVEHH
jgi:hypothetical protein